ncbi:MAG TPA: hypothetical protein VMD55_11560 [Terracidiphilus sp.]|jgi:hypothetical protein|nr:hypothetical protein [Terracidiphilus sp.]
MNWNRWIREIHRWLSIALTAGILINGVAVILRKYTAALGALAVFPLALLFFSGLYLFALPYAARWRGRRRLSENPGRGLA